MLFSTPVSVVIQSRKQQLADFLFSCTYFLNPSRSLSSRPDTQWVTQHSTNTSNLRVKQDVLEWEYLRKKQNCARNNLPQWTMIYFKPSRGRWHIKRYYSARQLSVLKVFPSQQPLPTTSKFICIKGYYIKSNIKGAASNTSSQTAPPTYPVPSRGRVYLHLMC